MDTKYAAPSPAMNVAFRSSATPTAPSDMGGDVSIFIPVPLPPSDRDATEITTTTTTTSAVTGRPPSSRPASPTKRTASEESSRTSHKLAALKALLKQFDAQFLITERDSSGAVTRSYYPEWALPHVAKLTGQIERLIAKSNRLAAAQRTATTGTTAGGANTTTTAIVQTATYESVASPSRGGAAGRGTRPIEDTKTAAGSDTDRDRVGSGGSGSGGGGGRNDELPDDDELFPVNPTPEFAPKAEWTINLSDDLPFVHRNRSKRVAPRRTPFQPANTSVSVSASGAITTTPFGTGAAGGSPPRHQHHHHHPPVVRLAETQSSLSASSKFNQIGSPPSSLAVPKTPAGGSGPPPPPLNASFGSPIRPGSVSAVHTTTASSMSAMGMTSGGQAAAMALAHGFGVQTKAQKTAIMRGVVEEVMAGNTGSGGGGGLKRSGTGKLLLSTDHIKLGDTFRKCGYNEEMWRMWLEDQMKRMKATGNEKPPKAAAPPPPPPPLSPKRGTNDPLLAQIEELQRKIVALEAANRNRGNTTAPPPPPSTDDHYRALLDQLFRLTEAQKSANDRIAQLSMPAPPSNVSEMDRLRAERDALEQKLRELREQMARGMSSSEDAVALRRQLDTLQAGYDALLKERNSLLAQLADMTKQLEQTKYDLMVRITNASIAGKGTEADLASVRQQLHTVTLELRVARAHNNGLQRLHSDEKKRAEEWKARALRAERELKAAQDLAEQRRRERDALAWSLEQKQGGRGISRFRSAVRKVLSTIYERKYFALKNDRQFQRELNALSRRLRGEQLSKLRADSEAELAAMKLAHERELADLLNRLKRRDEIITELKNRLADVDKLAEQFGRRVQALEKENETLRHDIESLRHQLAEATADTIDVQFSKHMIGSFKGDYLAVTENKFLVRAVLDQGDTEIYFSDYVEKISSWNQRQKRILIISEKAIYTFDASTYDLKRRIRIAGIDSVHLSKDASDLMVVHVNGEHDHLYCAPKRPEIMYHLLRLFQSLSPNHDKLLCVFGERMFVDDRGQWRRDVLVPQSQTVSFGTRSIFETQQKHNTNKS